MIRKYQSTDIEALLAVWLAASSVAHPFLSSEFLEKEKQNIREIYIPNTETWVFEDQNGLAGFISMIKNEVGALFVQPEYHGQGIGTQLMNFVAQAHEVLEVEVFEKNAIGRAFYKKFGFVEIKEHEHPETKFQLLRLQFVRPQNKKP